MSTPPHARLWAAAALAALACVAALGAPAAHAAGGTSAVCVDHFTATISPGIGLLPSSGTQTTGGETGTIACVGTIGGAHITGPGSIGYDLPYTAATCVAESSTGIVRATIPTTAGLQHLVGVLTVRRTALAFTADVRYEGVRYSGVGVAVPLLGDCVLTPMRRASLLLTGSLTDA